MGSPACAGIDPARPLPPPGRYWFPRVRGDRPYIKAQQDTAAKVPPRARG